MYLAISIAVGIASLYGFIRFSSLSRLNNEAEDRAKSFERAPTEIVGLISLKQGNDVANVQLIIKNPLQCDS